MSIAKLRKQGSLCPVVLTILVSEAKKLDMTTEYIVKTDDHGTITLIPKVDNLFKNAEPGEYY
ncbi:hypothetical protein [Alkalibacterium sp. 20]|uniref:hypothetical protein n=1 Tax=Alkalibacterium sp. 20 TaxID=1798803 RepID=UPI0008FFE79D|nr:hypothetical protein [Alkalibacterium sp. 20]OJF94691.1 hypothetical protein AX762_07375 [Alkalibacterium sp. 20]